MPKVLVTDHTFDPLDLDQVDADPHDRACSSQLGTCAIDETMPSGCRRERSTSSGRNFPVRTRIVRIPWLCAPKMSPSR